MADIQEKILSKYDIDISKENIIKLYKIEKPDLSKEELNVLIETTHKRWSQSINGANEKNAERDKARLEKAPKYEQILKDDKLRNALLKYYSEGKDKKSQSGTNGPASGSLDFSREYFKLIETSKKIRKEDVEFFFDYYQSERKNKKSIIEMLEKDFKVHGLGKEDRYASEDEEKEIDGKTKDESNPLIVNKFQEATVLKLHKCVELFEKAKESEEVRSKYPAVNESLYDYLELQNYEDVASFSGYVTAKAKEVYTVRQEKGTDYVPLVDLFNTLQTIIKYQDVVDNFPETKLLIKYPTLTPYMYSVTEMKPNTLKGIISVADRDYAFRDDADFILNYYKPVYNNFGIVNSGIGNIIKKAEKKANQNKVLNKIDEKLGRKKKKELPIWGEIIHFFVYWPVFLLYFVFEIFKAVFTVLLKFPIPVFIVLFALESWALPKVTDMENLLYLRKIFNKPEWHAFLDNVSDNGVEGPFETVLFSLIVIIGLLAIYILPSLVASIFVSSSSKYLYSQYDWIGYERTFNLMLAKIKQRTVDLFKANRKVYVKKRIPAIIINLLSTAVVTALLILSSKGIKVIGANIEFPHHSEEESGSDITATSSDETVSYQEDEEIAVDTEAIMYVAHNETSNIRSGPGQNYDVVMRVNPGEEYVATGNKQTDSTGNGWTWYEIYLDEDHQQTGWGSQWILDYKE